jgi:GTP pyrophosphokinase
MLQEITAVRPGTDTGLLTKAYQTAACWHRGQQRYSGDPYITHPVAVAAILAEAGADDQMLCAALLHDVAEYATCTMASLRAEFGSEIASLVAAVMALDAVRGEEAAAVRAAALQAAAAVPGGDRALVIKLADRLHNMRTLRYLPRTKQVRKARQALDVFVPIASSLHMDAFTAELECLATATLRRHGERPGSMSGRLLAAASAVLPASARDRWREEWLGELHRLPTRRERVTFALQIITGVGRLAITLYQPGAILRRALSTVLAAAATASGLALGGWKAAAAAAAAATAVLGTLIWILRSDDRTGCLIQLIHALRSTPPRAPSSRRPNHPS